jgi:hypothetical protein
LPQALHTTFPPGANTSLRFALLFTQGRKESRMLVPLFLMTGRFGVREAVAAARQSRAQLTFFNQN